MDKLKNLVSPSKPHSEDRTDQELFGSEQTSANNPTASEATTTQTGERIGQGSHFGNTRTTDPSATSGLTGNTTTSQKFTGQHHLSRDAAVGAGVGGIGEHELRKHENAGVGSANTSGYGNNDSTLGSKIGIGHGNTQTTQSVNPNTNSGSHLGRDAVVGAGVGGVGEHELRKHENAGVSPIPSSTTGANQTSLAGADSTVGNTTSGQHYGRDAAALGGVGAVGEGIHHHENQHNISGAGAFNTTTSSGPHSTNTANRLDPSVNTTSTGTESAFEHSPLHGGGAEQADKHHTGRDATVVVGGAGVAEHEHRKHEHDRATGTHDASTGNKSHIGRDAAIGAGGVGLAEHEHRKHENTSGSGLTGSGATGSTASSILPGPAPNTAGPHSKDWLNKLDPRVDSKSTDPEAAHVGPSQNPTYPLGDKSHTGRDTAAGVVGSGAYEAEKHSHKKHDSGISGTTTDNKNSHYGRDAALAGGAGGVAYEANKHKHDKDLTESEREAKHEQKRELKEEKREHRHGKDAVGGAALGTGAYEAEKLHGHNADKPLPTAPGNHGVGTGAGTSNTLVGDNTSSGNHFGRDATLGAGAGTALGAHEHDRHTTGVPLAEKPPGTDIGDKLHGTARNRGVPGPTGFPNEPGFGSGQTSTAHGYGHAGRDATALGGAAALGEHEHRKHENTSGLHSGVGNQNSGVTGNTTGIGGAHTLRHKNDGLDGNTSGGQYYDENTSRDTPNPTGYQQTTDLTGANTEYSGTKEPSHLFTAPVHGDNLDGSGANERNRLHKGPVAHGHGLGGNTTNTTGIGGGNVNTNF